ncbi:MAG: glycosyltransferase family 39 protein [Solirubrobacteraceae bacterium]
MRRPLPRRAPSRRALLVVLILLAALALRVAQVQRTSYQPINDASSYLNLASQVANTGAYSTGHVPPGAGGTQGPSAYFPPGFPYFLAAVDLVDGQTTSGRGSVEPARISQAVLGTIVVVLIGLVALEAFGETVALFALGLAAVYPVFIALSAVLVAENLMTALILAAIWAGLRARRSPHPYRWIAAAGAFTGLATLTHVNAIILVVPLAVAAWRARPSLRAPGLLLAMAVLVLTPWIVRDAVVMHRFIRVTDEDGITLRGTYNPSSAHDPQVPYRWRLYTGIPEDRQLASQASRLTEPELSDRLRSRAFDYIGNHPLSPFEVFYRNTRRMLELEGSRAWKISASSIDVPIATARIGVFSFWLLCLLALAGAFTQAVRRGPRWLWLAPVLLWLSAALVNGETPRFREPIDPFLILLAACALTAAARALEVRLRGAPVRGEGGRPVPAGATEGVQVGQGLP